jgi:hypothetical protein
MATWDFDDKQANFLDVLELAAASGPQLIKRGGQRLYVVSMEDWQRRRAELAELGNSPRPAGSIARPHLSRTDLPQIEAS